jgi:chaperone required for assembly of F1-ATPase
MNEWALKRFWKEVTVEEDAQGYAVLLDRRAVRTPAKRPLVVPTPVIAERIASEWMTQENKVDPTTMPWTRSANAALDKVATQRAEVEAHLAGYAGTDLLSYRAEAPEELAQRQAWNWNPELDWAADRFGARLAVTRGVMPVEQTPGTLAALAGAMSDMSDFQLTGFHDLVTLSGSFVLALSVAFRGADPRSAWKLSRLDEDWQIEQWGVDEEAAEHAKIKHAAFVHAAEFFHAA